MIPDAVLAAKIVALTSARAPRTICPSEIARALAEDWRPLMPRVRAVAAGLAEVEATQRGVPVDPLSARGPIRLRLRHPPETD
ncbi:hypothetical protein JANAI62_07020 [Jannaschia pagri]|uniref:DUF3253 domain-containing protein n=1 Tax=Jannaschia pagri TaxID=2829797 RepID=A0ABQ4NIN9_9RHOB|nr:MULTISPECIES: DUF3253 domain-containing protein [unclassified Jannaschia]GIT89814.1 hypothetical protein JANAI61_02720 [Jannaschia sp. AI_61]GIT94079.1 hypothetical protein JANAI62_07020 [Jannaschia sp. AI_62]